MVVSHLYLRFTVYIGGISYYKQLATKVSKEDASRISTK